MSDSPNHKDYSNMNPSALAVVGRYRDSDVYLIEIGKNWYITFDKPTNQPFWLNALNKILVTHSNYQFTTEQGLEVDMEELRPVLKKINNIIELI